MTQHDPLHEHDRQQAAQERGERLTLADLSDVEKEALELYRLHPRMLGVFSEVYGSGELKGDERRVEQSLIGKGLIAEVKSVPGFHILTAEGARLQAELWEQGGGE